MKRFDIGLAAAALAFSLGAFGVAGAVTPQTAWAAARTDGVLVTYRETSAPVVSGVELQSEDEVMSDDGERTVVVQPAAGQTVDQAVQAALATPGVVAAQPNYVYELTADTNDDWESRSSANLSPNQYWLHQARFPSAWDRARANGAVTVAVLDGPVDVDHPDLQANVLAGLAYDATGDGAVIDMSGVDPRIQQGHATHVSGIIAGVANNGYGIAGGSYNAQILPVMVIGADGGSTGTVLRGLEHVRELVEGSNPYHIRVVNLSLRQSLNPDDDDDPEETAQQDVALERAISALRRDGVVCVCAGGNWSNGVVHTQREVPADFDESVSVTALNSEGGNWQGSDYNGYKDVSAPGVTIWSAVPTVSAGSYGPFGTKTGTSMAAPMVSATFALLFAEDPSATVDQACEAVYQSAEPIKYDDASSTDRARKRESGTAGALDAAAAVEYLTASHRTFPDVAASAWYADSVTYAANHHIMNGQADGTFLPEGPVTREQVAAVLYNMLADQSHTYAPCGMPDVSQHDWYTNAVNWAVESGVFNGHNGTFGVGESITRQDLACVVANVTGADLASADAAPYEALVGTWLTADYARPSLVWAVDQGVIHGVDLGLVRALDPTGTVTRAQMAAIMRNCVTRSIISLR